MYTIQNGILHKHGKKQIALGTSYYASYHPDKYPVPPDGDRYGDMRRDVADIAAAGFNHIRTAAIGDVRWDGDRFALDSAFIDALVRETAADGMCSFVRLHGYSMNHRGYPDAKPLNQDGVTPEPLSGFLHDTLNHPELNADMDAATVQQAAHFAGLPEMLGFQIWNEPAYPYGGDTYDYNPHAIRAYRRWLADKGYLPPEDAARAEPPARRPNRGEDPMPWALWRLFSAENLSAMLCRLNDRAKDGAPGTESYTCHMPPPMMESAPTLGEDWFTTAEGMDILGLTQYMPFRGEAYYLSAQTLDGVESAAAVFGKRAWIIEFCCRTHMTADDYERQMISALGAGLKGINYYLWRADMAGPEEQLGGMVWNDRTKTGKFDEAVKVNALVNRLSETLASAEKLRSGVAILYSMHAGCYFDGISEGNGFSRWYARTRMLYAALKKLGVTADFVRAEDLARNPLDTRLLMIPTLDGLSEAERAHIAAFAKEHAAVTLHTGAQEMGYRFHPGCGEAWRGFPLLQDWCYRPPRPVQPWSFRLSEVLRIADIQTPIRVQADHDALGYGFLANPEAGYYIACLTNIDSWNAPVTGGKILFDEKVLGRVTRATCHTRDGSDGCALSPGEIALPALNAGGCLVVIEASR